MECHTTQLSPAEPEDDRSVRESIVDFWRELSMSGDAGCTTWEVLEPLQDRVTECLALGRLPQAANLTGKALCLISGLSK